MAVTTIEKCARAIYNASPEFDQNVDLDGRPVSKPFMLSFESVCERDGDDCVYFAFARAALKAIRDPDEATADAPRLQFRTQFGMNMDLRETWRAAIDAILAEK